MIQPLKDASPFILIGAAAVFTAYIFIKHVIFREKPEIKKESEALALMRKAKEGGKDGKEAMKALLAMEFPEPVAERDFFASHGKIKDIINRRKARKKKAIAVIARMELYNGKHIELLADEEAGGFTYRSGKYLFDVDVRYEILTSRMFGYDFHEGLCLPVKRNIPVEEIKKRADNMADTLTYKVRTALDPVVLLHLIKAEISKGLIAGTTLGKALRIILIIVIMIAAISLGSLLTSLYSAGAFDKIINH